MIAEMTPATGALAIFVMLALVVTIAVLADHFVGRIKDRRARRDAAPAPLGYHDNAP